jgi:hypothetical protein
MCPRAIVETSLERGLDMIAVCDHNSAENTGAAIRAGELQGLNVLPGIEINSREEVHSLAIFPSVIQALAMQEIIYMNLQGTNRPELFGDQVVANEFDEVEGFNDRFLIGATQLSLHRVVNEVHKLGGLSIASHVDRPSYSVISQLGFIPPDLKVDALEVSDSAKAAAAKTDWGRGPNAPVVTFSDAHTPESIGSSCTVFLLEAARFQEIHLALSGSKGRRVILP